MRILRHMRRATKSLYKKISAECQTKRPICISPANYITDYPACDLTRSVLLNCGAKLAHETRVSPKRLNLQVCFARAVTRNNYYCFLLRHCCVREAASLNSTHFVCRTNQSANLECSFRQIRERTDPLISLSLKMSFLVSFSLLFFPLFFFLHSAIQPPFPFHFSFRSRALFCITFFIETWKRRTSFCLRPRRLLLSVLLY